MDQPDFKKEAADQASGRYRRSLEEIDRIRNRIYKNRKGHFPLADITHNAERLDLRIEREGVSKIMALERINGVPNFQDIYILEKIMHLSATVCRLIINTPSGASGYGTGFLIAPNLLLTNHHVLPHPAAARSTFAQFNYQLCTNRKALPPLNVQLRPDLFFMTAPLEQDSNDPYSGLDFTIVAVAALSEEGIPVESIGFARLDEGLGKVLEGENCVVIQHPGGDFKKVVLRDIRMISLVDNFLIYESDTLPGSSGSMVLGLGTGEVVALHHSGVPRRDAQGRWLRKNGTLVAPGDSDEVIDWLGNEGVRISSIIKAIRHLPVVPEMEHTRQQLLHLIKTPPRWPQKLPFFAAIENAPQQDAVLLFFHVKLIDHPAFLRDWQENAARLLPGLQTIEKLFPAATQAPQSLLFYIGIQTARSATEVENELEALPHVHAVTPAPHFPVVANGIEQVSNKAACTDEP